MYGHFHHNYSRFFLQNSQDNSFDFDIQKRKSILINSVFKNSSILKKETDKAILYFNLPEYILSQMIVPTKVFPVQTGDLYPESAKIIEFFGQKKGHVPNMFLLEIKGNSEKYIVGAFSKKNWNKDLLVDRNQVQKTKNNEIEIEVYDPMSDISDS